MPNDWAPSAALVALLELHRSPIAQAKDPNIIRIDEQEVASCRFWLPVDSDRLSRRSPPPAGGAIPDQPVEPDGGIAGEPG